jgi:hypothetical protein
VKREEGRGEREKREEERKVGGRGIYETKEKKEKKRKKGSMTMEGWWWR